MKKPNLSFGQIWNLSFGFLGVQIGYSLQNSNTSTIFESLGADHFAYSYYIGGAILLFTVLFTALRTREYPPEEFSKYSEEVLPEGGAESSTKGFLSSGFCRRSQPPEPLPLRNSVPRSSS